MNIYNSNKTVLLLASGGTEMAIINGTDFNDNGTWQWSWPFIQYYPSLDGTNFADTIHGKKGNDIIRGHWGFV